MQVVAECSDLFLLNCFATSVLASLASAPLNLGEKFRCARNRTSRFKFWAVAANRNCSETFHNRRRRCASPKTESALFVEHAPPNWSACRIGIDFAMLGAQLHSSCVRPPVREWKRNYPQQKTCRLEMPKLRGPIVAMVQAAKPSKAEYPRVAFLLGSRSRVIFG